ncbi:hypothetical protein D910_04236 [Dendroctonus ponderosae]|uniref:Uncharacterized protein n=1 Tax=Dendroctonus ponderosae TaxID=77166 RepID=U4U3F1_DENPD|nr:hypothetical protein D910_04236 [Dendroctonus ponderosae]
MRDSSLEGVSDYQRWHHLFRAMHEKVLFLLLRVCDGAKIKHAYGGSGSYLMSNTYPQMRKDILSKEDDFVAKGKSKFPIC